MVLGILDSHSLLILMIYTVRKDNKMNSWTDPHSHILEGELIQCQLVDQAKNVQKTVGQLPTKAV